MMINTPRKEEKRKKGEEQKILDNLTSRDFRARTKETHDQLQ